MNTNIDFHDTALCEAAEVAAPRLSNLISNLNQISADIKRLEAWLAEHGLCIEVSMSLPESIWSRESDGERIAVERKRLKWTEHEQKWRLVYTSRYSHDSDSDYDRYTAKPLIEMPAQVRIDTKKHLPAFLRTVAANLPSNSELSESDNSDTSDEGDLDF